ncbi:MAG: nucleoside triphosphate pyrophosphohydrolase [Snowella sp.]
MPSFSEKVEPNSQAILDALQHLIEVVAKLRSPDGGCPWDLEQTQQTLIPYIIEEAYETVHAIKSQDQNAIAEELGDLLLQVVLQAQVAQDSGYFSLKEVAQGIAEKLIRRHPHVFGEIEVDSVETVRENWEKIKATEKGINPEEKQLLSTKLTRYTQSLPPLMAGTKISKKAATVGFEWENIEGVWEKFEEELAEFKEALQTEDKQHQESELGDLFFTLINLARWYQLNPSDALDGTNQRFIQRLSLMENFADKPLQDYTLGELEMLWRKAKSKLNY